MQVELGDRLKRLEDRETERRLLPGIPVYARLDGRSFHSFTKGFNRPYDEDFACVMGDVCSSLVEETNAKIGYVQSDEISLCWLFDRQDQMWFDGKVFKLTSNLASMATAYFYRHALGMVSRRLENTIATFDCRVINLPTKEECANMFLWRERDATKNAISMAASTYFSPKQLAGKNGDERQEMLWQEHGINFNDYPDWFKRGSFYRRETYETVLTLEQLAKIPPGKAPERVIRHRIVHLSMPSFVKVTNRAGVIFDGAAPRTLEEASND